MSTKHTPNYQLNQWERTDKVIMEDFNADNAKIDAALAKKAEQSALAALQTVVAKKGNCRLEMGTYVGTGSVFASVTTSFPPQVFIVMGPLIGVAIRDYEYIHFTDNYPRYANVTWRDDGLSWLGSSSGAESLYLNSKGTTYYYAALG